MISDYAQTFCKHDEKEAGKSSNNDGKRGFVRVRQVAVNSGKGRTNSLRIVIIGILNGVTLAQFMLSHLFSVSFVIVLILGTLLETTKCLKVLVTSLQHSVIDAERCLD